MNNYSCVCWGMSTHVYKCACMHDCVSVCVRVSVLHLRADRVWSCHWEFFYFHPDFSVCEFIDSSFLYSVSPCHTSRVRVKVRLYIGNSTSPDNITQKTYFSE